MIQFLSPTRQENKGGTIVVGELTATSKLIPLGKDVRLHHRKRPGQTRCLQCLAKFDGDLVFAWQPSRERHEIHPQRCNT